MNKLKDLTSGITGQLPSLNQVEDCMDTFKLVPENFFNFMGDFKTDSLKKGSEIYRLLKFIGVVILFICVFPAIPFFFVIAVMISVMKYMMLKLRTL